MVDCTSEFKDMPLYKAMSTSKVNVFFFSDRDDKGATRGTTVFGFAAATRSENTFFLNRKGKLFLIQGLLVQSLSR